MNNKIRIVNWLLTRRCNLKCDYCAIVKNYENMPDEYPPMSHYIKNEMVTTDVIAALINFKKHNPDAFHIFYGGEPLLRKDLATIINFCNREDIHYTIISNNTREIWPQIDELVKSVKGTIKGFTASVDPSIFDENDEDSIKKSLEGFANLKAMKRFVDDVVAEVTVMKHNQKSLYQLVKMLSDNGINSDITFVDIAKNPYYDFSNITDHNLLVKNTAELANQFQLISDDKELDIHMKDVLIPKIWGSLPSNMDCGNGLNGVHNLTVDADGSIRLCLRIRGVSTPSHKHIDNIISGDGEITPDLAEYIQTDKDKYCQLCNHTCQMMSSYIHKYDLSPEALVHLDRRN